MAKEDFCFTYYDGDAARDKAHMNRLERGAYDDLISAQRKRGHLSIDDIKKVLSKDFNRCWASMEWILKKDDTEKYFIEWVDKSIDKSRINSIIQKEKIDKYWEEKKKKEDTTEEQQYNNSTNLEEPYKDKPYKEEPLENGNGDVLVLGKSENHFKKFPYPTEDALPELPEKQKKAAKEIFKLNKNHLLTDEQINIFWGIFKVQNVTGKKYYADVGEVYSYFINWIKGQNISNGKFKNNSSNENEIPMRTVQEILKERENQRR